jgi:alkyldihydroxyacetonephosphate synthase
MIWWGWGDPGAPRKLPEHAEPFLAREIGPAPPSRAPVALSEVRLPESTLPASAREDLARSVGAEHVRDDREARITHAAGKGYVDLVRLRAGDADPAPDAVVLPGGHDEVAAVLEACARAGVAVVPFGGGTSVVGGVEPLRGGHAAAISLDLGRLDGLLSLDERSRTAVLGAGLVLPEADDLLGRRGWTLGHVPQSYEYATVGGCVATRSAGQASTGYGRIDDLVLGLRAAAPAGEIAPRTFPATAAGPDLRELLVGSEGALGVLTEVSLRVAPRPAKRRYEGWLFRDFAEGAEALRALVAEHAAPDVARLSDEEETRMSLAFAGSPAGLLLGAYGRLRGRPRPCLGVFGWEDSEEAVRRRRARCTAVLRRHGGAFAGGAPGAAWARARFAGPYLRDALLERGIMAETLETAAQWSDLEELHRAVAAALHAALAARGTPALVACHVSHLYESGASLYFTFIARQETGAELEQWRAAKEAASDAILANGGTITHHHAVGRDHIPWHAKEVGPLGVEVLRAAKGALDPAGIMNPGKLL